MEVVMNSHQRRKVRRAWGRALSSRPPLDVYAVLSTLYDSVMSGTPDVPAEWDVRGRWGATTYAAEIDEARIMRRLVEETCK